MSNLDLCCLCGQEFPDELKNQIPKDDIGLREFPIKYGGWSPNYVSNSMFLYCPKCTEYKEISRNMTDDQESDLWLDWIGFDYEICHNETGERVTRILGKKRALRDD
jgi:hypothetical protein